VKTAQFGHLVGTKPLCHGALPCLALPCYSPPPTVSIPLSAIVMEPADSSHSTQILHGLNGTISIYKLYLISPGPDIPLFINSPSLFLAPDISQ
jgi:hypothetical protein